MYTNSLGNIGEIFRMSPERALPLIEEETPDCAVEDEAATEETPVRQLDGTDAEWKYRGRTESEHCEHHPIGAPAGLSAQKDEGFQRFYKAVVSPTHVRVTAGGRIVPNTRVPSSPTSKWTRDNVEGEHSGTQPSANTLPGDMPGYPIPTLPHHAFGAFPPLFPGFIPGMPATMAHGPPPTYPIAPWQMGFGMGNPFNLVQGPTSPTSSIKLTSKTSGGSGTACRQGDSTNSESSNSVRISPPENFDPSRPYYVHGQWVTPGGGPFYHYGMTPLPGFPVGAPAIMQPRYALGTAMQQMQPMPTKAEQTMHNPAATSSSVQSQTGHFNVPISSIRPSDITKKQIESLKSTLRYYEDQLQYNKHQIDEKSMENQAEMVRDQIQQFEKTLKGQFEAEKAQYPKSELHKDSTSMNPYHNGRDSSSSAVNDFKSDRSSRQSSVSQAAAVHVQSTKSQRIQDQYACRRSSTLKSVKSASAPVSTKITPDSSESSEPTKKSSSLPVGAALAPPFHPRADGTASVPVPTTARESSGSSTQDTSHELIIKETHATESIGSEGFTEKPYLVGRLPEGRAIDTSNSMGYLYSRELTEDELRARHMYWGKAPRHLQKGLPKFDGKDFYPPSPVKAQRPASTVVPTTETHLASRCGTDHRLKTPKPIVDPFRSLGRATQRLSRSALAGANQSEHLPNSDELPEEQFKQQNKSLSNGPTGRSYDDFRKALAYNSPVFGDGTKDKSSDDEDSSNILFRGRKYMASNGYAGLSKAATMSTNHIRLANVKYSNTRNEIWQSMWKRSKSSAVAVPGTVSSMTARGVLPNYAGHATASLTPAIANASTSPKGSSSKLSSADDQTSTNAKHSNMENRPPFVPGVKETV